jgi:hypothetical protein
MPSCATLVIMVLWYAALARPASAAACTTSDFNDWIGGSVEDADEWFGIVKKAGMRPIFYQEYPTASGTMVNAVAARRDGGSWSVTRGSTTWPSEEWKAGYCFTWVSAHTWRDTDYFEAISEECAVQRQYRAYGLSAQQFLDMFVAKGDEGYVLRSLAGYGSKLLNHSHY